MQTINIAFDVLFDVFYFIWRVIKSKFFYIPVLIITLILGVNYFFDNYRLRTPILIEWQSPIEAREMKEKLVISPVVEEDKPEIEEVVTEVVPQPTQMWAGKATYYETTQDGCIGCKPYHDDYGNLYYIMANGERLDDTKMTVAFNHAPLGTVVEITNVANGLSEMVEVTDTGGFNDLGRIADMSVALKDALQCSDMCDVTVATY